MVCGAVSGEVMTPVGAVDYRDSRVTGVVREGERRRVTRDDGTNATARRVLLATGVVGERQ